jgi:hypothetical protein
MGIKNEKFYPGSWRGGVPSCGLRMPLVRSKYRSGVVTISNDRKKLKFICGSVRIEATKGLTKSVFYVV